MTLLSVFDVQVVLAHCPLTFRSLSDHEATIMHMYKHVRAPLLGLRSQVQGCWSWSTWSVRWE
jgi:hypothetical protein